MALPDSVSRRRVLAAGVATLGAGGGVVYGASKLTESEPTTRSERNPPPFHQSTATSFGVDLTDNPIMGRESADLDLLYWGEYQCPFCKQFEDEALPKLIENDVRTGRVRVVFLELPYMGEDSTTAAVADRCIWEQVHDTAPGRYWRWRSTIYANQEPKNSGWANRENLLSMTASVDGVDSDAVGTCLDGRRAEFEEHVETERRVAREYGFEGTPSFLFGNRQTEKAGKLVGAQPYENFERAMDQLTA